jgi:DNA-binding GntR family transcriptional regulator
MIIRRELVPGEKIPQEAIAQDLGISRTPLVNALKLLEKEHVVELRPRRGYIVREFNRQEMIALFEVREVLEGLAARKAAQTLDFAGIERLRRFFADFADQSTITDWQAYAREDEAFHSYLVAAGANTFLRDILAAHDVVHASYQTGAFAGLVRPPEETVREHRAIINAIAARDPDAAESLMRTHLANSAAALRRNAPDVPDRPPS